MAKKDESKNNKKAELIKEEEEVVERVKKMMEPERPSNPKPDTASDDKGAGSEPSTAPEITDLPLPKEPLKIKILRDEEDAEAKPEADSPSTAPEVDIKGLPVAELEAAPDKDLPDNQTEAEQPDEPAKPEEETATKVTAKDEPAEAGPKLEENIVIDEPKEDAQTAKAVEDIIRSDSDAVLKAEDEKLEEAFRPAPKQGLLGRFKDAVKDLWQDKRKRKIIAGSLLVIVVAGAAVPHSRYFTLNLLGVRASTSVQVFDESTRQPLRNVSVIVRGQDTKTDENGFARVNHLKLGPAQIKIQRRAFAEIERDITIGWGSNPLGEMSLKPTGTQYAFEVRDFLSGKGIVKAEATSGDAQAFSDESGKILLTMEDPGDELEVVILADGYRVEEFVISGDTKDERKVDLVAAKKHAYISRRDGRYDVYSSYADGRDDKMILKGTGSERDDMVLVPHPKEDMVAVVSTRDGLRNKDGYLLSTLMLVDLNTKASETIETSERIQIIGWYDERIVYMRVVSGASAANPKRNRLMAYHYKDDTNNELAASNYFNDVMAAGDRVYYAPSGAYANGVNISLFSVKPDGTDRKVVLDREVWNMFRTSYDKISISVPKAWYEYKIGDEAPSSLNGEPANLASRVYVDSPDGKKSLWVDSRDGKGVLILYDKENDQETVLLNQSGLKQPVNWLNNNTLVYRVKTDSESADYARSLDGGESKKVADVTNTDGLDRWYYY